MTCFLFLCCFPPDGGLLLFYLSKKEVIKKKRHPYIAPLSAVPSAPEQKSGRSSNSPISKYDIRARAGDSRRTGGTSAAEARDRPRAAFSDFYLLVPVRVKGRVKKHLR